MISEVVKLVIELAGDLLKIATSAETDEQIIQRLADRVAETAKAFAALPGIQAQRWKDLADALKR